jgi:hypothetical protein
MELVQGIRKNDNIYKHSIFIDYLSFLIVSPLSIIQNQIIYLLQIIRCIFYTSNSHNKSYKINQNLRPNLKIISKFL